MLFCRSADRKNVTHVRIAESLSRVLRPRDLNRTASCLSRVTPEHPPTYLAQTSATWTSLTTGTVNSDVVTGRFLLIKLFMFPSLSLLAFSFPPRPWMALVKLPNVSIRNRTNQRLRSLILYQRTRLNLEIIIFSYLKACFEIYLSKA